MPAYRAMPQGRTQLPVVLVISEIFGVHEHIADVARRFAKLGYLAIAPGAVRAPGRRRQLRRGRQADGRSRLQGARRAGDGRPRRDASPGPRPTAATPSRLGITGFCWGGRITWLYAAHNPAVKAGRGLVRPARRRALGADAQAPGRRGRRVCTARCSASTAAQDTGIPLDTVEQMKSGAGRRQRGGAGVAVRGLPRRTARLPCRLPAELPQGRAEDGWQRCLAWFKDARRRLTRRGVRCAAA